LAAALRRVALALPWLGGAGSDDPGMYCRGGSPTPLLGGIPVK